MAEERKNVEGEPSRMVTGNGLELSAAPTAVNVADMPRPSIIAILLVIVSSARAQSITFNTNFEDASLGRIEKLDEQTFRCHVAGQSDERGRNRQANWYYFRMDHVKGRDLAITLTDFVGEYNDKPGACR